MNTKIDWDDPKQPFYYIKDELGEIQDAEQLSDGIYWITAERDSDSGEYYLAMKDAPELSSTAKRYGQFLCGVYVFSFNDYYSGWKIVEYEMYRYLKSHGKPLPEGQNLLETAVYAMEYHPEYFGRYPVPMYTPYGRMLRHRALENGIYWLETDACRELLAVCYPIWQAEFSKFVREMGELTEYDQQAGVKNTYGYLFFTAHNSCAAIAELMITRRSWEGTRIRKDALMNAIRNRFPEYASDNNLMAGQEEPAKSVIPDAGEDFLIWDDEAE